jgi:hypothetical protein
MSIEQLLEILIEADGPVCLQDLIDEASVPSLTRVDGLY